MVGEWSEEETDQVPKLINVNGQPLSFQLCLKHDNCTALKWRGIAGQSSYTGLLNANPTRAPKSIPRPGEVGSPAAANEDLV